MDNITYYNFKNICRTCLFNCELKSIKQNAIIIEILNKLGCHFETNDELPQQLCRNCFEKINEIHAFVLQCNETYTSLIKCLNNFKNKRLKSEQEIIAETNDIIKEEIKIEEHNIEFVPVNNYFEELNSTNLKIKQELVEETNNELNENMLTEIISEEKINVLPKPNTSIINVENKDLNEDTNSLNCSININSLEKSKNKNKCKEYVCDVCNKRFTHLTSFKRHKSVHSGERPFICDICNKGFPIAATLKLHKRLHSDERPHKCDQCSMSFTESFYLKRHLRWHSDERPFECDVCAKTFKFSHVLIEHKRMHNGERPYECDVCRKTFKCSSNLIRHKKIHSGERPHKCDVCDKSFIDSSNLSKHKKLHQQKSM